MSDPLGFGKYVPGFDFLQSLAKQAAGGVAQGVQQGMPQLPSLGNWIAPTFNVEELDKRIDELKAVHFWLDQNAKALGATIQALEVQKMTLATLKGMNFNLGDVANALKLKTADVMAGMAAAWPRVRPCPAPRRPRVRPPPSPGWRYPPPPTTRPRQRCTPSRPQSPNPRPPPRPRPARQRPSRPRRHLPNPLVVWSTPCSGGGR